MKAGVVMALVGCLLFFQPRESFPQSRPQARRQKTKSISYPPGAEWQRIRKRLKDEGLDAVLTSRIWSLTHNYSSMKHIERLMTLLEVFGTAIEKDEPRHLEGIGGITGFQERVAALMSSGDDEVSGFAAIVLGVCGDQSYARRIGQLLNRGRLRSPKQDDWQRSTARGTAATALGLLGAKEYAPKMLNLLLSENEYDREGAAIGLAYLGDKTHGRAIAKLLRYPKTRDRDAASAIHALLSLGLAADYLDDIAKILQGEFLGDSAEMAAYALAKLGAKQHSRGIARLLSLQFEKGYAAKALAIMGASEYIDDIAALLGSENSLYRKDGALALGVMHATQHEVGVSKLLKDEEEFVQYYAAVALVLMEANQYAREVIPIIEKFHQDGYHLNEGDFDSIVLKEFLQISTRFDRSLAVMKAAK